MTKHVQCQVPGCERSWSRDPVLEVQCPDCGAPVGSRCKRPSGHPAMKPHNSRDLEADRLGHYGPCPFGRCSKAPVFATEPTEQGNQYVIPGCERDKSRGPSQMDLF